MQNNVTKSALIGLAVGDALGVPVEFMNRADVRAANLKNMEGCDTHPGKYGRWSECIPAGAWSDDTSMAIAAMDSIVELGEIDYEDIMQRFQLWWNKGAYTSKGFPFGLGGVCSIAMRNYKSGTPALECGPKELMDNGNGSLMRILPFSLYCIKHNLSMPTTVQLINGASGITHGHEISKLSCLIFTVFLKELLAHDSVKDAWEATRKYNYSEYYSEFTIKLFASLLSPHSYQLTEDDIAESGYVVDSLTAAVYSMLNGTDYESSVLLAINLGYDTDTNGAITGALAGAFYGYDAIPERWRKKLLRRYMLESLADHFDEYA